MEFCISLILFSSGPRSRLRGEVIPWNKIHAAYSIPSAQNKDLNAFRGPPGQNGKRNSLMRRKTAASDGLKRQLSPRPKSSQSCRISHFAHLEGNYSPCVLNQETKRWERGHFCMSSACRGHLHKRQRTDLRTTTGPGFMDGPSREFLTRGVWTTPKKRQKPSPGNKTGKVLKKSF